MPGSIFDCPCLVGRISPLLWICRVSRGSVSPSVSSVDGSTPGYDFGSRDSCATSGLDRNRVSSFSSGGNSRLPARIPAQRAGRHCRSGKGVQQHSLQYRSFHHLPFGCAFISPDPVEGSAVRPAGLPAGHLEEWHTDCDFDSAQHSCGSQLPDREPPSSGRICLFSCGTFDPLARAPVVGEVGKSTEGSGSSCLREPRAVELIPRDTVLVTMTSLKYIGMDVHKESISIAVMRSDRARAVLLIL